MTIPADPITLTPDEQWRRWIERYSWHLDLIPGLLEHIRAEIIPLAATRYDAVRVDVSRDGAPVPFRVDSLDTSDELWAALIQYAENVDQLLRQHAPVILAPLPHASRWRTRGEAQGIRAGADVRHDAFAITAWLIDRVAYIAPLTELGDSEDYLFTMIRRLRARYLTSPAPRAPRRACELCLVGQVTVTFTEAPISTKGERVAKCNLCGQVYR